MHSKQDLSSNTPQNPLARSDYTMGDASLNEENYFELSAVQQTAEEYDDSMLYLDPADARYDWIENFFIQWSSADGRESRCLLYSNLYESSMQKYLLNTACLDSQFMQTGQKIEITAYLINRIFLQAIVVHPQKWEAEFFRYLAEIYGHVSQARSQQHQAQAIYPQSLMQQLEYLQEYYLYLQGKQKKPKADNFYIPMKQFILGPEQLCWVLYYHFPTEIPVFIASLGNKLLKSMIKDYYDLIFALNPLPQVQKKAFLDSLGHKFLKSMISSIRVFLSLLGHLSEEQKEAFIDSLGQEFLKSMITDSYDFGRVLSHLSKTQKAVFIVYLGHDFLKSMIKERYSLDAVLEQLSEAQIPVIFGSLDLEFLKSIIKVCDDLDWVLTRLPLTQIPVLIEFLGDDFLRPMISCRYNLALMSLSGARQQVFIGCLGHEFLKSMIKDCHDLSWVVDHLPEAQIPALISSLEPEFLESLTKDSERFGWVLRHLSVTRIPVFIGSLSAEFLKAMIQERSNLGLSLGYLSSAQKKAFIDSYKKTELEFLNFIEDFCKKFENEKDPGLIKMSEIIDNPALELHEKINQILALANGIKEKRGYSFFQKSPDVKDLYRTLAELKAGTQGTLTKCLSASEPKQYVDVMRKLGG